MLGPSQVLSPAGAPQRPASASSGAESARGSHATPSEQAAPPPPPSSWDGGARHEAHARDDWRHQNAPSSDGQGGSGSASSVPARSPPAPPGASPLAHQHQHSSSPPADTAAPAPGDEQSLVIALHEARQAQVDAKGHIKDLLATVGALSEENAGLKEQVQKLKAAAAEVAEQSASAQSAYEKLQGEAAAATLVQESQRKEMVGAFKAESGAFKRAAATMEATMRRLAQEKSKLAQELEHMSGERENMRCEAEAARSALRDSKAQIVTLKQRIVRLAGGKELPFEMFGEEHVHIPGRRMHSSAASTSRASSGGRTGGASTAGGRSEGGRSVLSVMGGQRLGGGGMHELDLETLLLAMPPAMRLMWDEKQTALAAALTRAEEAEKQVQELKDHLKSLQGEFMLVASGEDDSLLQRIKRRQLTNGFKPGEAATLHHPAQLSLVQAMAEGVAQARSSGNVECIDVALYGSLLQDPSLDDVHSVEVTREGDETPLPKPLAHSAAAPIFDSALATGQAMATAASAASATHRGPAVASGLLGQVRSQGAASTRGTGRTRDMRRVDVEGELDKAQRTVVVLRLLLAQSKSAVAVLRDQLKQSLTREGEVERQLQDAQAQLDPLLLTSEMAKNHQHLLDSGSRGLDSDVGGELDVSGDPGPAQLRGERNALLHYARQLEVREGRLMKQVDALMEQVGHIRSQLHSEAMKATTGQGTGGAGPASTATGTADAAGEAVQRHPTAQLLAELQRAQDSGAVSHDALQAATSVTAQLRQLQAKVSVLSARLEVKERSEAILGDALGHEVHQGVSAELRGHATLTSDAPLALHGKPLAAHAPRTTAPPSPYAAHHSMQVHESKTTPHAAPPTPDSTPEGHRQAAWDAVLSPSAASPRTPARCGLPSAAVGRRRASPAQGR